MQRLRQLRTERGLSQARLAALAEVDPSTVNQIERGAREASPATLRKLASALDVSIADLLEDVSPKGMRRSSPEPSFNDVLEGERLIAAAERFTENLRYFTDRWREEMKEPHKQDLHWCAGVQATAIGLTSLFSALGMGELIGRKMKEAGDGSPASFVEEMKKGRGGRAGSDRELRAAMNALLAFKEMHEVSDQVLEAAESVDWIAVEEAEQRRQAFSLIQGELSA